MTEESSKSVVGFAGSLRDGSFNRALLREAVDRAPATLEIETFDLAPLPMFDADLEEGEDPEPVASLKGEIDDADGLLIVSPEYNHSISPVTKNAIDWASRPPERVLSEKPVAIAGASPSMTGTARAQAVLRDSLASVGTFVMPKPEVLVARAHEKFEDGELADEETADFLETFLEAFDDWIDRVGSTKE